MCEVNYLSLHITDEKQQKTKKTSGKVTCPNLIVSEWAGVETGILEWKVLPLNHNETWGEYKSLHLLYQTREDLGILCLPHTS